MFDRLNKRFLWQPDPEEFIAPLRRAVPVQIHLDQFPLGIDNTRIDVTLSPIFMTRARLFVRRRLLHDSVRQQWLEPPAAPDASDLQAFRDAYVGMMEVGVEQARRNEQIGLIQLLQLAVMKFVLRLVDEEFQRLRAQLQRAKHQTNKRSSSRSVETHERLVLLMKEGNALRYRLIRKMFREILKLEAMRLSKLRKSVLNVAWPLPRRLLFNPLLQLPSLWADEQVMNHYTLVCTDQDDPDSFDRVNRAVIGLFAGYLPDWSWPVEAEQCEISEGTHSGDNASTGPQAGAGRLQGFQELQEALRYSLQSVEYEQGLVSWLDVPGNMERLIYSVEPKGSLALETGAMPIRPLWEQKGWTAFHGRFLKRLFREFRHNGLEQRILAGHSAPAVYRELNGRLPVRLIYRYLMGEMKRRALQRRLQGMTGQGDLARIMRVLDRAASGIRAMPRGRCQYLILCFLHEFTMLRRDLKLGYLAHVAMDRINILTRPRKLELSRGNGTLQEFVLHEEQQPEHHRIRSHVVLKADVRGSTEMIQELRQRNLNPASHFSLNFFEPINKLLDSYGARKVFVEGDAVILSIFEYEDTPYRWLCISHACGLARKILQVVDEKNLKSRQHGLPELELGLGIAFSEEAPTFLYDEEREVMISPAINRADQLSSCSALLRNSSFGEDLGRGIEVVVSRQPAVDNDGRVDHTLRYNVNGIELDMPAFMKLQSELALKVADLPDDIYPGGSKFYVGRYPDLQGTMHWLVVREAPVRVWGGGKPGTGQQHGHRFYQVVTEPEVLERVKRTLDEGRHSPAPDASKKPQPTRPRYLH